MSDSGQDYSIGDLFQEAINCLPSGFAITDSQFQPVIGNKLAQDDVEEANGDDGLPTRDILFASFRLMHPQASEEECRKLAEEAVRRMNSGEAIEFCTPSGRYLRKIRRPMTQGRYVYMTIDLTEAREREQALLIAQKEAEAAKEAKARFLANTSHEIRTPLNGILGMAQVLEKSDLNKDQRMQADLILESGHALKALLDDVLDLSQIEANKMEIAPVEEDFRQLLLQLQERHRMRASEKQVTLRIGVDSNIPSHVVFDARRVSQCLSNIFSNAIKFSPGGTVDVYALARYERSGLLISITVSDTGIGMTEDVVEQIFTPFAQADSSNTRHLGSSGLGLSVTRQLARLMGGDVTCESVPGKGSVFTMTFLARLVEVRQNKIEDEDAIAEKASSAVVAENRHVLLVDDHPLNRRVARLFLEPEGYSITEAEDGQQALDRLAERSFDVVLLDLHMPVLDGFETLRYIRDSQESWRDVPVIALTADAMSYDRERYKTEGINGYIAKPIEQRDLLKEIGRLIRMPPAEIEAENSLSRSTAAAKLKQAEGKWTRWGSWFQKN